jgi:flavin-dependent dehydrogenase
LVEKAGAEVWLGTTALGADNTPEGVKVVVRGESGEQTLEGRTAIAADGFNSAIVENLGLNKKRKLYMKVKAASCVLEGVECTISEHECSWLHFECPSIVGGSIGLGAWGGDRGNRKSVRRDYEEFAKLPMYEPWFRHARIVKEMAFSCSVRTPIREPVVGNVMIISDAAAPVETWRQGAVACGYQAVKAIEKELNGQRGYPEYINWWQKAFYFNEPGYFKIRVLYRVLSLCTPEEIDYIYQLFQDQRVVPALSIAKNPELVKKERPGLYEKLKQNIDQALKSIQPLLAAYPPEADGLIYGDSSPEVYLGPWRPYPSSD